MESNSNENERRRVTVIVAGRVQGVFFRASTLEKAQQLSVVGTVRNLADRTVEIVAEGPKTAIEELLRWAHQGPPSAQVASVSISDEEPTEDFKTFEVLR